MAKTYPVSCECGTTHQVAGSAAGSNLPCRCGRTVEVPSLARLKADAGMATISPDLELQYLTQTKSLPIEFDCVHCGLPTDHQLSFSVVCERPEEKGRMPIWQQVLLIKLSLILYLMQMVNQRTEVHGRHVSFRLPVRVCEACASLVRGRAAIREVLGKTPVYARLLEKFPHAEISPTK